MLEGVGSTFAFHGTFGHIMQIRAHVHLQPLDANQIILSTEKSARQRAPRSCGASGCSPPGQKRMLGAHIARDLLLGCGCSTARLMRVVILGFFQRGWTQRTIPAHATSRTSRKRAEDIHTTGRPRVSVIPLRSAREDISVRRTWWVMGRCCKCNGRLLCMCLLPCMMTGHLLIYVMVSIFVTISYTPPKITIHYVAPGITANTSTLASHPLGPFWNLRLEDGALWNQLQHAWDRKHNPLLRGNETRTPRELRAPGTFEVEEECLSDCLSHKCWLPHMHDLNSLPEPIRAFVGSMHCREYTLLINQPAICHRDKSGSDLDSPMLFMAIKSQVGNFENRQAIRETWGRTGLVKGETSKKWGLVQTVFLLGRQDSSTGPHPDLKNLLELENQKYRDILQWDFRDSFFNLTLKDLLFWHWLQQHCPGAAFIFKGDDDVFVRTGALMDFLHKQWDEHNLFRLYTNQTDAGLDLFVGDVIVNAMPNREPATKYYIPENFYKGSYPPYAGGGGVVYSGSLALRLKEVSERVRLFPIDDVYLGMCLYRLGLAPSHHPGFLTFDLPESERGNPCAYRSVLLVHRRSPKEMLTLWRQLQKLPAQC